MEKTIVILGGGHGGIHLSHYLLSATNLIPDLKVILVSPTEEFFWNLASVRVVVPDIIPVDSTFFSIPKAYSKYPAEKFEFALGKAHTIDPTGKSITVRMNNGQSRDISYHTLIVATGSRAKDDMPWKSLETSEKTREAIAALRSRIDSAKSIVIGGAGATGVEFAGELGAAYGRNKTVTVICPSKLPLVGLSESTRSAALKELEKLGVTVLTDAKVTNLEETNGSKRLELTHGDQSKTTIEADEFIPTYGIEFNTEFAPESWKDSDGRLKVDATLRQPSFPNVFIVGDAANAQPPTAGKLMDQLTYMKKQLVPYLKGETIPNYVKNDSIGFAIATGPNRGTGQVGNWRLFSLLVWWFKSRTLGLDMAGKAAEGLNL